jgi:hypothetical protein
MLNLNCIEMAKTHNNIDGNIKINYIREMLTHLLLNLAVVHLKSRKL